MTEPGAGPAARLSQPTVAQPGSGRPPGVLEPSAGPAAALLAAAARLRRTLDARHSWWAELGTILGGYWIYELTRGAAAGEKADAVATGRAIYHFEQRLHLDPEHALNHALAAHRLLSYVAGYFYGSAHFVATVLLLGYLWWRRPREYGYLRTVLVATSLLCLLIFWLLPTAPPRLAIPGLVDVLNKLDVLGARSGRGAVSLANLYAAMPSLHLAWASWVALSISRTARRRWVKVAIWGYPAITALVVLATANHYLSDVVAGVVTLLLVAGLLRWAGFGSGPSRAADPAAPPAGGPAPSG